MNKNPETPGFYLPGKSRSPDTPFGKIKLKKVFEKEAQKMEQEDRNKKYKCSLDRIREPGTTYAQTLQILSEFMQEGWEEPEPPTLWESFWQGFRNAFTLSKSQMRQEMKFLGELAAVMVMLLLMMGIVIFIFLIC